MGNKKKILILSYSFLKSDPRIQRQIFALQDSFDLCTAGYNPANDDLPFVSVNQPKILARFTFHLKYPVWIRKIFSGMILIFQKLLLLNKEKYYESQYWNEERKNDLANLKNKFPDCDVIIANDIETLPLALALKSAKTKIIFDSHEYHPREFEESKVWLREIQPYVVFLCTKYLKLADKMFTVCDGIAREYKINFGVDAIVVTNAANYVKDLEPGKVNEGKIKLIHHGAAIAGRKIEEMIKMMDHLDERFEMDFMLVSAHEEYGRFLREKAKKNNRIRFVDPVPTSQIPYVINKYDVGVYIIAPSNFNNEFSLPNKFFEFIQGRLAIAIAPSPEMAGYVKKFELGVIGDDYSPESLAKKLMQLNASSIEKFKQHAHTHAKELSAENNYEIIRRTVVGLY